MTMDLNHIYITVSIIQSYRCLLLIATAYSDTIEKGVNLLNDFSFDSL